jgi:hypothetical protein
MLVKDPVLNGDKAKDEFLVSSSIQKPASSIGPVKATVSSICTMVV